MTDRPSSTWGKPKSRHEDKRERAARRDREGGPPRREREGAPPRGDRDAPRHARPDPAATHDEGHITRTLSETSAYSGAAKSHPDRVAAHAAPTEAPTTRAPKRRDEELRVFGINACLAIFRHRPGAIRKVYLTEGRKPQFGHVLSWCAKQKIGYRFVENDDLEKLTQSTHHEGVCFEVRREAPQRLEDFLSLNRDRTVPSLLILLDGVGNPHNFGAVLRIAAHFGADGVLLPPGGTLALSGAACRVAEGGAEFVPLVATGDLAKGLDTLRRAGYSFAATVVRDGRDLYAASLPPRLVLMFGAEGGGLSPALLGAVRERLLIPGTGNVESLNIASAVAVIAGEFWRRHRRPA